MIESTKSGIKIHLKAQPGSKTNEIQGEHAGLLKIKIQAAPQNGKANAAIEAFLAEVFSVAKKQVKVVRGLTVKTKVVAIDGVSAEEARAVLLKY